MSDEISSDQNQEFDDYTEKHGYKVIRLSNGQCIRVAQNTYLSEPLDKIIERAEEVIRREKMSEETGDDE